MSITDRVFEVVAVFLVLFLFFLSDPPKTFGQSNEAKHISDVAIGELLNTAGDALEMGRYPQAVTIYRQVLKDYPETSFRDRIYVKLAEAYQKNQDPTHAASILEVFLDEFPNSGDIETVLGKLAEIYIELEDFENASSALERQRRYTKDVAIKREVTERLVAVLLQSGERVRAIENLVMAEKWIVGDVERDEQRDRIENMVSEVEKGDLGKLIERFSGKFPSDVALLRLANVEEGEGLLFEAERELRRFLNLFPGHPQVEEVHSRLMGIKKQLLEYRFLIGVLLPMSEKVQPYSAQVLSGIRLAIDRFASPETFSGDGRVVGLVIRDTEGGEDQLDRTFRELVKEYKVVAMIGPLFSRNLGPVAKRARRYRIPVITPSATQDVLPSSGGFLFRNSITLREQGSFIAEYSMLKLGFNRFCILYPEDNYGRGLMEAFKQTVLKNDGEIIGIEFYSPESKDFGPQIRRLKRADIIRYGAIETVTDRKGEKEEYLPGFDAIYLPGDFDQVGLIAAQLAFFGISDVVPLGSNGWHSKEIIRIGGEYVNGGIFVDGFFSETEDPAVFEFVTAYRQRYQKDPTLLVAQAYDSAMMILQGLQANGSSGKKLRAYLEEIKDYPGASGTYQSLDGGILSRPLRVIRVNGGKFVQVN